MADDVTLNKASGTFVAAADDVSSVYFQKIKLDGGGDGATQPIEGTTANGIDVDVTRVQGNVTTVGIQVTVSTDVTRPADTTGYVNGDCWSDSTSAPTSGGFTFTGAARASGGSGIITDAIIVSNNDPGTQLQGEIWIFDTAVTNVNDNAALVVSDAEIKTFVGKIEFSMEDAGNNMAYHARYLNIGFTTVGSANLRFLVKTKNAYTPASAEVLTVRLKILQTD
jgi:hypothetical protein